MKDLGQCSICSEKQANYKCPRCLIVYCSLPCYKSPNHVHEETPVKTENQIQTAPQDIKDKNADSKDPSDSLNPPSAKEQLFAKIALDPQIKSLLSCKSLQVHLAVLVKLLEDSLLTNEPMAENRREIANMRLCELRKGGKEENSLIEEFVERILHLQDELQSAS